MDRINISEITCQAHLGTTPQERSNPQPIIVDLCLYLDLEEAGVRDELEATIDYVEVVRAVKGLVSRERFLLLESLVRALCRFVLNHFPIEKVQVAAKKFPLVLRNEVRSVEVRMSRTKDRPDQSTPA